MTLCDIRDGYTVAELADEMQRSERTIRRWIAEYCIDPVGQVAGYNRYPLAAILAAQYDTRIRRETSMLGGFTTV